MKVSIERGHFEALLAEFPRLQPWAAQLRFGNRVEMAFADLHDAELAQLVARYQAGGVTLRAQAAQLLTLQQALAAREEQPAVVAELIKQRWGLPAPKWLRVFKAVPH